MKEQTHHETYEDYISRFDFCHGINPDRYPKPLTRDEHCHYCARWDSEYNAAWVEPINTKTIDELESALCV